MVRCGCRWMRSLEPNTVTQPHDGGASCIVRDVVIVGHGALLDRVLCELLGLGRSYTQVPTLSPSLSLSLSPSLSPSLSLSLALSFSLSLSLPLSLS
jgi:hypothetical protein